MNRALSTALVPLFVLGCGGGPDAGAVDAAPPASNEVVEQAGCTYTLLAPTRTGTGQSGDIYGHTSWSCPTGTKANFEWGVYWSAPSTGGEGWTFNDPVADFCDRFASAGVFSCPGDDAAHLVTTTATPIHTGLEIIRYHSAIYVPTRQDRFESTTYIEVAP